MQLLLMEVACCIKFTGPLVKDLMDGIDHYVRMLRQITDVYLIFDLYKTGSIKSNARTAGVGAF